MSNSYREDCNLRKQVREGIIEQRPALSAKSHDKTLPWLVVEIPHTGMRNNFWGKLVDPHKPLRFRIIRSYKKERDARKFMDNRYRWAEIFGLVYVVERELFERVYAHLKI